jgi:hypothetical protein
VAIFILAASGFWATKYLLKRKRMRKPKIAKGEVAGEKDTSRSNDTPGDTISE